VSFVKKPGSLASWESVVARPEWRFRSQELLAVSYESLAVEAESLAAKSGSRK
jgi:hypothetical protein